MTAPDYLKETPPMAEKTPAEIADSMMNALSYQRVEVEIKPADELRQAAATLREAAKAATRGPWIAHRTIGRQDEIAPWTVGLPYCREGAPEPCEPDCGAVVVTTGREGCEEDFLGEANATWIALASPALAEPLASWLEQAACSARACTEEDLDGALRHLNDYCDGVVGKDCTCFTPALAVARALNGSPK